MKQIQLELFPDQDRKGMYHKSEATPLKRMAHIPRSTIPQETPERKGPDENPCCSDFPEVRAGDDFFRACIPKAGNLGPVSRDGDSH